MPFCRRWAKERFLRCQLCLRLVQEKFVRFSLWAGRGHVLRKEVPLANVPLANKVKATHVDPNKGWPEIFVVAKELYLVVYLRKARIVEGNSAADVRH
jgi:hypothetical protein